MFDHRRKNHFYSEDMHKYNYGNHSHYYQEDAYHYDRKNYFYQDHTSYSNANSYDYGCRLMKQMRMVVEYTRCRVKTKSKLTNLKINSRIVGYNGK